MLKENIVKTVRLRRFIKHFGNVFNPKLPLEPVWQTVFGWSITPTGRFF